MQILFEKLTLQLQQQYDKEHYHLLMANIKLAGNLIRYKGISIEEGFLENFKHYMIALDKKAQEYHFRHYLNLTHLQPLSKYFKDNHQEKFFAVIDTLIKKELPDSKHGKVNWQALNDYKILQFSEFFEGNENKRYQLLKTQQDQRLTYLETNPETYEYAVFCEVILSYWRIFKKQYPLAFKNLEVTNLLSLGESLHYLIAHKISDIEVLWSYALLLQEIMEDKIIIDSDQIKNMTAADPFQTALIISAIAERLPRLDDIKAQEILETALNLNQQLENHLPEKLTHALLSDYKPILQKSRLVFKEEVSLFEAQKRHSEQTIDLINIFIEAAAQALGNPPCDFAFCILGSTARQDRRPYSDVELMFLYEPHPNSDKDRVETYVFQLISCVEMMIVRLGETHHKHSNDKTKHNAGFHIDSSSHLLVKGLWGTPQEMANKFILNSAQTFQGEKHAWIEDENFYSFLRPVVINEKNHGSEKVIQRYHTQVSAFLKDFPADENDCIAQLQKSLNINNHWFGELKRHEMIAVSCLIDVLEKSVERFKKIKKGELIDIKQSYYKPLCYLALNFKLYYQLQARHPADIFQEMKDKNYYDWAGEEILNLLQEALLFIIRYQVNLHLDKNHQEEELAYQKAVTESEKSLWAGLDMIEKGIILPLHYQLSVWIKQKEKPFDFKDIAYSMLKVYLSERENWLVHWQKESLSVETLLAHPLIIKMENYPASNGWSPYYEKIMMQHLNSLQLLVSSQKTECLIEGLPNKTRQMQYLPSELIKQCFNDKGEFEGSKSYSGKTSQVRAIEYKGQVFYLKVKEGNDQGLMGREFAVQALHLLLGGENQLSLGWPLKLTMTSKKAKKPNVYYCWISKEIKGNSLADVMRYKPELLKADKIEQESYSQLFLLSYLTCPEDGQPDNFKVQITKDTKTKLLGIDMGQSFVSAYREGKSENVLSIKTMIYLLDSINHPLAKALMTRLKLIDVKKLFLHWQENIKNINKLFSPLILVDIDENVQQCVRQRLVLVQQWALSQKAPTGMQLLYTLEPLVAISYQSLLKKIKTPEDFYAIDPKAYVKDPKSGKIYSSATFKQIQQQTLTPEQLQRNLNITPDYFDRKSFDFSVLNSKEQRFMLELIKATAKNSKLPFTKLNLSGCNIINEKELIEDILEKMPNLEKLSLSQCEQFDVNILFKILTQKPKKQDILCPHLYEIFLTIDHHTYQFPIFLNMAARKSLIKTNKNLKNAIDKAKNPESIKQNDSTLTSQKIKSDNYDFLLKTSLWGSNFPKKMLFEHISNRSLETDKIGIDFCMGSISLDKINYKIQFWDTASRFGSSILIYDDIHGVDFHLICFELSLEYYLKAQKLLQEIDRYASEAAQTIIIGFEPNDTTKTITSEEIMDFCSAVNIPYLDFSKIGENAKFLMEIMAKRYWEKLDEEDKEETAKNKLFKNNRSNRYINELRNLLISSNFLFPQKNIVTSSFVKNVFFFLDNKTLYSMVPLVCKSWHRLQKQFVEEQAEQKNQLLLGKNPSNYFAKNENEEIKESEKSDIFSKFLK